MLENGLLSKFGIDVKRMQSRMDLLDVEIDRNRKELQSVQVIDGYRKHEKRANILTRNIRNLNEKNIADLVDLIGEDILERKQARTSAVKLFADISRHLYDEPGELLISRSKGYAGFAVETTIRANKSAGKSHMQIFCFDLVLAILTKESGKFPGFLFHDSHIFDGVDGRQIGLALDIANKLCKEHGIQYIVALNSDDLDKIAVEEIASNQEIFDPNPYINEIHLDDTVTEDYLV